MTPSTDETETPKSDLSPALSALLGRLVRGWSPTAFRPGPLVDLRVGTEPVLGDGLGAVATGFDLGRGSMSVQTVGPPVGTMAEMFMGLASYGDVAGAFETGQVLTGRGMKRSVRALSAPLRTESVVVVDDWMARSPEAVFWVSALGSAGPDVAVGNLGVQTRGAGRMSSSGHLALETVYRYYLVTRRSAQLPARWWVVIDPAGRDLDHNRVSSDLTVMRYALATPFDTHTFFGIDDDGRTVAGFGLDTRRLAGAVPNGIVPPVPTRTPVAWAAPFVAKLAAAVPALGASPVSVALDRYDQSVRALDIDNQFLHVAGAVTTLAQAVTSELGVPKTFVSDDDAWGAWVAREAGAIGPLARDGKSEALIQSVRDASKRPIGSVVADVYAQSGIEGGAGVGEEVSQAYGIYLRGSLVPLANQGEDSALRGYDRVQALRRAFAVLLASQIGYGGRVSSYEAFEDTPDPVVRVGGPPAVHADQEAAQVRLLAIADVSEGRLTDWPTYETPRLPDDPRVAAMDVYAGRLEARTGGDVAAALRPLPSPPRRDGGVPEGEGVSMSFRLYLTQYPETQTALFSVNLTESGLLIRGWENEDRVLEDVQAVESFLLGVAESDDVRYRVQQLLSVADERARTRAREDALERRPNPRGGVRMTGQRVPGDVDGAGA